MTRTNLPIKNNI